MAYHKTENAGIFLNRISTQLRPSNGEQTNETGVNL